MSDANRLPPGWVWADMADLAEVGTGTTPNRGNSRYWQNGSIPWVTSTAVNQLFVTDTAEHVSPQALEETNLRIYPKHTLLVALYGEGKTRGKVTELLIEATINQALAALELCSPAAECRAYIKAFLQSHYSALRKQAAGGMQPNLNLGLVRKIRVPVAPLNEQYRIVNKLDELLSDLDAGVSSLERARANLKRYRAAILRAAVTGELTAEWRAANPNVEPATKLLDRILTERRRKWEVDQRAKFDATGKPPPKNWQSKYIEPSQPDTSHLTELPVAWCWAKLDQLISYLRNGYFQSPAPLDSGVRLLRINAVRPMRVDLSECRYLPPSEGLNEYLIENGDLLFTRYNGSVDLLGVAGMVRGCYEKVIHPDKLIRVKAVLSTPLPNYLELACNTGESRRHMVSRARTTAGQTGISGGDIKDMPVPLPPLAEQAIILTEIEQRLSVIAATENYIAASLKRAARLRQSILKDAFAGRLVPQDPNDEPASVLLERIRLTRPTSGSQNGRVKRRTRNPRQPEFFE